MSIILVAENKQTLLKQQMFGFQLNHPVMAIRTSMSDFRKEEWMTNMPLYAIGELLNLIEKK